MAENHEQWGAQSQESPTRWEISDIYALLCALHCIPPKQSHSEAKFLIFQCMLRKLRGQTFGIFSKFRNLMIHAGKVRHLKATSRHRQGIAMFPNFITRKCGAAAQVNPLKLNIEYVCYYFH